MTRQVYLDNNATTPLHPEVRDFMVKHIDAFGNASSFHSYGRESRDLIEGARETIAASLGCLPEEIIFTASGSESNNTVINSIYCEDNLCQKECTKHLISSSIEHPSVWELCRHLKKQGKEVTLLPVNQAGIISPDDLRAALKPTTGLVSIMFANNEVGSIQPIKELAAIARENNVLFHTDAVQALGKIKFSVDDLGVDMLSLSGHKLYGPKGIGVLYIRKGTRFCPMIRGGHHEQNRRAGTENNIGIIGLGKAFECVSREIDEEIARLTALRNRLKEGILSSIPDVMINGSEEHCLPGTLNVSFKHIEGESILLMLDLEGIAVSTGSACSSGTLESSYVLSAMGRDAHLSHGSIRFSLGRDNIQEDVDYVLQKLPPVIKRLRMMSPLGHD